MQNDKFIRLLNSLISDAKSLLRKANPRSDGYSSTIMIEDREGIRLWANRLTLLCSIAPDLINPWRDKLTHTGQALVPSAIEEPLSALETVKYAIDEGLLTRYRDLVLADTFTDLQSQAEYLLDQRFFLAAGVILRAILEEKLRNLCKSNNRNISKLKPTISDYNQSLYADPAFYDKAMMLNVTALAAIGNDAAHNSETLAIEDVRRLNQGVRDFLIRYSS